MGNFSNAILKNEKTKENIPIIFNPSSYSINSTASYKVSEDKSGNNNQNVNYQGGGKSVLSMELEFAEEPDGEDVSHQIYQLERFLKTEDNEGKKEPQKVSFIWGSLCFTGYISSVKATYTRFTRDGKPIRAKAAVEMERYITDIADKPAPKQPAEARQCTTTEDMDIWNIAYKEYQDTSKWRDIAQANGVTDPLSIEKGTKLTLP